jgi:predicted O-methyltransferase YrrM
VIDTLTYMDVLDRLHISLQPSVYVEIGVFEGRSLSLALTGTTAIGVDPAPRLKHVLSRSTELINMTSGQFFRGNRADEVLQGRSVDLAFVDGMHLFEAVLEDVVLLERHMSQDGVVVLHDVLPPSMEATARERSANIWTGDVWRIVPTLKQLRQDLNVEVVNAAPSGIAIVSGFRPGRTSTEPEFTQLLDIGRTLRADSIEDIRGMAGEIVEANNLLRRLKVEHASRSSPLKLLRRALRPFPRDLHNTRSSMARLRRTIQISRAF